MVINKHTILYAEDDLDDLLIVQQAFERFDHINLLHAPDGKRALHALEDMVAHQKLPCLVILDINMPVMNGKEVLQAIRDDRHLSKLPVVLFSTSNSPTDSTFAERFNAGFITKPIDFSDLEKITDTFVEHCNFGINNLSASN